jgi:outer membrane usher protein
MDCFKEVVSQTYVCFEGRRSPEPDIIDGFAIVDVGVPNVAIQLNNREAARTTQFCSALVPDLESYRMNRISINPLNLPSNSNVAARAMDVVPARWVGRSDLIQI